MIVFFLTLTWHPERVFVLWSPLLILAGLDRLCMVWLVPFGECHWCAPILGSKTKMG